ncbi:9162_t:CDS:2, partial [Dentiscutata heterogama]
DKDGEIILSYGKINLFIRNIKAPEMNELGSRIIFKSSDELGNLGNELTSEQKDPFIFGEKNFKERIDNEKVKIDEKEQGRWGWDFEYDKTLNYENGSNRKCRISYEENKRESENIKRARFDESGGECSNTKNVNGFGSQNMLLIYNEAGGGSGRNSGSGDNSTSSSLGTGNTEGSGNSTRSNLTNGTSTNNPTGNSGSGLTQKQKLALDEIFKNLQMQRTDNDDNDLEELRKVSRHLADLLNIENINKKQIY